MEGSPVWQKDYEAFMRTVGFQTKLCKPRHPFTKGKVERLIRFVKDNFLAGRVFWNVTDLNCAAVDWCDEENGKRRPALVLYLCPERRISFDRVVNYEGHRFGVPYSYMGKTVRVCRDGDSLHIYSADMKLLVTTHDVT